MNLSYREVVDLAINLAIDLDNFSRGKIRETNSVAIERLEQWFVKVASILCSQGCIYDAGLSPLGFVALNQLFSDFFCLPKCSWNTELGERINEKIGIFAIRNTEEAARLRDFCVMVSQKLRVLHLCSSYHRRLAA